MNSKSLKQFLDFPNILPVGRALYSLIIKKNNLIKLKAKRTQFNYLEVMLYTPERKYSRKVHRLIGLAWIDNPNNYPEIDHINKNKHDNRIENLRWISTKLNKYNIFAPGSIFYRKDRNRYEAYYYKYLSDQQKSIRLHRSFKYEIEALQYLQECREQYPRIVTVH